MKQTESSSSTGAGYLVEMTFAPFAHLPAPAELQRFRDTLALPTFAALERLEAEGRIAGGTYAGAAGFAFIARAGSPGEVDALLSSLPLWPRAATRVVPLGTFAARRESTVRRLAPVTADQAN